MQQLTHAAQAAVAQMVDIVLGHKAVGQRVHIVDGGEDIINDDVLGHQLVGAELALLDQLLALILLEQLHQYAKAHPLLDPTGFLGIEVHIAAHVAHAVGDDLEYAAVIQHHADLAHTDGVQLMALVAGQHMALVKEDLTGSRIRHRQGQLLALGALPQGQLLVELVTAHDTQIVAARIEEQILNQRFGGIHRGRLAGALLAVDLQQGLFIGLAGILLQRHRNAGVIAEELPNFGVGLQTQCTDQAGNGDLAILIDTDPEHLGGVGFILHAPR